jgi:hypothetical protein
MSDWRRWSTVVPEPILVAEGVTKTYGSDDALLAFGKRNLVSRPALINASLSLMPVRVMYWVSSSPKVGTWWWDPVRLIGRNCNGLSWTGVTPPRDDGVTRTNATPAAAMCDTSGA